MVTRVRPARAGAASPRRPARRACSGPASSSRCGRAPHAAPRRPAPRPAAAFDNAFVRCRAHARSLEQPGVTIHNHVKTAGGMLCLYACTDEQVCAFAPAGAAHAQCVRPPPVRLEAAANARAGRRCPARSWRCSGPPCRTSRGAPRRRRRARRPSLSRNPRTLLYPSYTCMRYHSSCFPLPSHLFHTPLYHVPHAHPKVPRLP